MTKQHNPPGIEFRDPPARLTRGRPVSPKWLAIAEALRARPGEWAYVGNHYTSKAAEIKQGRLCAFRPAGSFDAVARNVANSRGDLYVCYIGDPAVTS